MQRGWHSMAKRIAFSKPFAGWMTLKIGRDKFQVSYLTDLWAELDLLLTLPDEYAVSRVLLEGEDGGDLFLTAYRCGLGDGLVIIWEKAYTIGEPKVHIFDYKAFMDDFARAKKDIGMENYKEHFLCNRRPSKKEGIFSKIKRRFKK